MLTTIVTVLSILAAAAAASGDNSSVRDVSGAVAGRAGVADEAVRGSDAPDSNAAQGSAPDLGLLLREYNRGIERSMVRIDSLRVSQIILEPQEDGAMKEARAVLTYSRSDGMTREITEPGLPYMVGRYTLASLLGPLVEVTEYEVRYEGREVKEDVICHRLALTALDRDSDHFDGTLWVSCEDPGPVRIVGAVADPPFPAVSVSIDKAFERRDQGFWLVRRHTGEAEVSLLVRRRGTRHIFYEDYIVSAVGDSTAASERNAKD